MARTRPTRTRLAAAATLLAATGAGAVTTAVARRRRATPPPPRRGRARTVASVDGTLLHVRVSGPSDADRVIVLSHGWAMSARFWHHQVVDLATDHLVVTYDQRGHGRSGDPQGAGATVHALGDDLAAVLRSIPGDRPILLVGHSMGAMSVVSWSGRHHDPRVAGAVLCNTGIHALVPASAATFGRVGPGVSPLLDRVLTTPAPLGPMPPSVLRPAIAYIAHGPGVPRPAVDLTMALARGSRPAIRAAFGRDMLAMDLRESAARLTVPVLVVAGDHDRMTPVSLSHDLVDVLPVADLAVVVGAGHQAPLERPDEVTTLVRGHLAEALAASREQVA